MLRHLMLLLGFSLGLAASATTLTLPPRVAIEADEMLLGQIAVITDAGDDAQRLGQVVLGAAPIPGQSRTLTREMIRVRLRQFGFNPETITVDCPPSVLVTRLTTAIKGETMVEIAREWLTQRLAPAAEEKLELTPMRTPADAQAPTGALTWECAPAGMDAGSLRHVMVTMLVDGRSAWRGVLSFRLTRYAEVLVARKAIARGETLSEGAVATEWREITTVTGAPLRDVAELDGRRAVNSLAQNAVLTLANTEPIPLVKRNDTVHVQAKCGSFIITTVAVALEDGLAGATIRVRNPDTRQEYAARVVAVGLLEL
ncbi:MAG: flagellar basal body P-ring formation chaperone FlgA [Armatimonadota bacterium]